MEEIQNEMRANSGKKFALARARAAEKSAKHPQLMDNNQLEPTDTKAMSGGGDAGMKRLIGRKKGCGKAVGCGKQPKLMVSEMDSEASSDEEEGGARHQGRMLAEHIQKLHGAGFAKRFLRGAGRCGGAKEIEQPMGNQVISAVAQSQVPPGGRAALAYGSAPQAPASFARNSVGMGQGGAHLMPDGSIMAGKPCKVARGMRGAGSNGRMIGAGQLTIHHDGAGMETTSTNLPSAQIGNGMCGGKRAIRGAAISKLMKEHGMTLGEASRHLKEHGSA